MKRKICVVTGSRAEYGLIKWLMFAIKAHPALELQLVVTGQHLEPSFGLTYQEIEADGFFIDKKINMALTADSSAAITQSMALELSGFSEVFTSLTPDILVVLGDRYEILIAAIAAMMFRIPIAHLHGGESTEGAFDEAIRHAVTKLSHLHFVGAPEYRQRVIQLGEQPEHVFLTGGLNIDALTKVKLLSKEELQKQLDFKFRKRNLIVTFHPVTLEKDSALEQMSALLKALSFLKETSIIFTAPNSDPGGGGIFTLIQKFCATNIHARFYISLGQTKYLSCLNYVDAIIGNSSSGLAEAPSFKIGTINIGDRQKGRIKAESVIDCKPICEEILQAIAIIYSPDFKKRIRNAINPYGEGGASEKITAILASVPLNRVLKKQFFNISGLSSLTDSSSFAEWRDKKEIA